MSGPLERVPWLCATFRLELGPGVVTDYIPDWLAIVAQMV